MTLCERFQFPGIFGLTKHLNHIFKLLFKYSKREHFEQMQSPGYTINKLLKINQPK